MSNDMQFTPTTRRVVIEGVQPAVDCGRFAVKRVVGDEVVVGAAVFADGHDVVEAVTEHKAPGENTWTMVTMEPKANDRWTASFELADIGRHWFRVAGWVDHFATWAHGVEKKAEAGQELEVEFRIGADLIRAASVRANGMDRTLLEQFAGTVADTDLDRDARLRASLDDRLHATMKTFPDRTAASTSIEYPIDVDRERARFSSWYELFPRSWGPEGRHGTLADVADRIDYVADMGFDVLYLPPISPIGTTKRKGPNNTLDAGKDDPGVPWAVGSKHGGHTAVNPELGSIEDLRRLRDQAADRGIELALDIAFQCSPDHPWVTEHPEWFTARPDGTIQYAENPPKRYEDIYPINFETTDPEGLWNALKGVFDHWIDEGIRIFRVDNPHTKAFHFWEWVIDEIRGTHPDVILLAEAFTRPRVMHRLAKVGFTQSYTYFTWRNTAWELKEYMSDLAAVGDFFRPNFWPNTPDILPSYLQADGRAGFIVRLILAASLSSNYGIYGPSYELLENAPRVPGSEEYLDSEKYQLRNWDLDHDASLAPLIRVINQIRREHPALQHTDNVTFNDTDNDMILCYTKRFGDDVIVCTVNLDPHHRQSGWIDVPLDDLGISEHQSYQVHDAITDRRFLWSGRRNYVELDPGGVPAHLFVVRRHIRTEHDFDYYL